MDNIKAYVARIVHTKIFMRHYDALLFCLVCITLMVLLDLQRQHKEDRI